MNDLSKTIAAKSDQLNADDLIGGPITIKITNVSLINGDQPVAINYEGDDGKPWKPCKSMRRVLIAIYGTDGNKFIGHSLTLFRDPTVAFGGAQVGGVRISHMTGIDKKVTMSLTASRNSKRPFSVEPLNVAVEPKVEPADPDVLDAGEEAAGRGVANYTAWLGSLDDATKATIKHKHKEWSAKAKAADEDIPL